MTAARVTLAQRANAHGQLAPERDITEVLLSRLTAAAKPEPHDWSYGIAAAGSITLQLADPDGIYGPESSGQSIFSLAGRAGAEVVIHHSAERGSDDEVVVWHGMTSARSSRSRPRQGISELLVRSAESVFFDAALPPGAAAAGTQLTALIDVMLATAQIAAVYADTHIQLDDVIQGGAVIGDEVSFVGDGLTVAEAFNQLAAPLDLLLSYDAGRQRILIAPRGGLVHPDYPELVIDSALDILRSEDGAERVVTELAVMTSLDGLDEVLVLGNAAAAGRWGARRIELDLSWLRSLDGVQRWTERLLARLSRPRDLLQLRLDGWQLPPGQIVVGAPVRVALASPGLSGAAYGQSSYGAAHYTRPRHTRLAGAYYIHAWERDCVGGTLDLTLRRRAVG